MVVGKAYYFVSHAYYHFLGIVDEITGKRSAIIRNVIRVHSCQRDFTGFFKSGVRKTDTQYTVWPDGTETGDCIVIAPWNHPIPTE